MREVWLSLPDVAATAGVSARAVQLVIQRYDGQQKWPTWRGSELVYRDAFGRGGAAGKTFEIALSSLPAALRSKWEREQPPPTTASLFTALAAKEPARLKRNVAQYIVSIGERGTSERAGAIRDAAAACKQFGHPVSERTLRDWVKDFEKRGVVACRRPHRADIGKARVIAWRAWDRAMDLAGVSETQQAQIAEVLSTEVRSMWASGASSVANIRLYMQRHCRKEAEAVGIALDAKAMAALCRVPSNFIAHPDRKRARLAHIKRTDAGGYAAKYEPRIRRDRTGLVPLEIVAGDVRHSDIYVRRPDGSLATPKVIAFQDLATNRLFTRMFLMPQGEMIQRKHVLSTLRDLMADRAWGVPRTLYLDNGGEFQTLDAAGELARLADMVRAIHSIEVGVSLGSEPSGMAGVLRSRPYNPQSKVIEGTFSSFTRSIEAEHVGFIGGNRMAKKVENQGRAPTPMSGNIDDLQAKFRVMVAFHNAKEQQRGFIKGFSPDTAFNAAVAEGWRAIVLDPHEFELAFGQDDLRTVQTGGDLWIDNRVFHHDDLAERVGERVRVRVPILGDGSRVVVLTDKGEPSCVAAEAARYPMRDLDGAKEQGRRNRALGKQVAIAAKGARLVNFVAEQSAFVSAQLAATPAEPLAVASVHPVLREEAAREASEVLPMPSRRSAERLARSASLRELADAYRGDRKHAG